MQQPEQCPFCHGDSGYQTKTVWRIFQQRGWDAEDWNQDCADEMEHVSGGKKKTCLDCGKDVTSHINN